MTVPSHAVSGWRDGWYVVPYQVSWRDLDAIGHVNNAVYLSYFEWARTQFWFDMVEGRGVSDLGFIVARTECDFRLQLELSEKIDVCVRIADMRTSSFDFTYEIRRSEGHEVVATGKVVVVLYDWDTKAKKKITDELRSKVRSFQGEG